MDKDKMGIIICSVLIIILLVVIICAVIGGKSDETQKNVSKENITSTNTNNSISNSINNETNTNNTISENQVNEILENANTTDNSQAVTPDETTSNVQGKEENEPSSIEQTDEEKVIDLAKAKWGTADSSVSFTIENRDGNVYMVCIRDMNSQDAIALAWYQVDLSTGEVTQQ